MTLVTSAAFSQLQSVVEQHNLRLQAQDEVIKKLKRHGEHQQQNNTTQATLNQQTNMFANSNHLIQTAMTELVSVRPT